MKLSKVGLNHLKASEGFSAKAYWDRTNYAIGYGHNSPKIRKGDTITKARAEQLLRQDIARFERCVNEGVLVPLEQHQFDALVSFSYNVGCGAFQASTLLKRLNLGYYNEVPEQMMLWRKPRSIIPRRKKEVNLWKQGSQPNFFMGSKMKKLAIVVGHNKRSQGAAGQFAPLKGVSEFVYNTDIAKRMARMAADHGLDVRIFYRDGKLGYSRQISRAYRAADKWGADATIELHFNGSSSSSTRYSTTLVAQGSHQGFRLGQLIQMATVRAFGRTGKQDRGITTRTRADRGGWSLRAGKAPAVLTEPFFGSNPQDCKLAAKESTKEAYAKALLEATAEFLELAPRKSLAKSRTMRAGIGGAGMSQAAGVLMNSADDLGMIEPYVPEIRLAIALITVVSVGIMLYARWDDWKKEKR